MAEKVVRWSIFGQNSVIFEIFGVPQTMKMTIFGLFLEKNDFRTPKNS